MHFSELMYWNSRTYGHGLRLRKDVLRVAFVAFCLATPCTNWMIPGVAKLFPSDVWLRW